jgi:hypothetical protein
MKEAIVERSRKAVMSSVVAVASFATLAAGIVAGPDEVEISIGKTVFVTLAPASNGKLTPVLHDVKPSEGQYVSFDLSKVDSGRMLKVKNLYDKSLLYSARMCIKKRHLCAETSVLPVQAGISAFESWGDPIDTIVVSAIRLE